MSVFQLEQWINPKIQEGKSFKLRYKEHPQNYVQLALMENPFPWPEKLRQQWLDEMQQIAINRYPPLHQDTLKQQIRDFYPVPNPFDILLGNGSNEIIQTLLRAFAGQGHCVLVPNPSYFIYERLAEQMGYDVISVNLKNNFEMDLPKMLECIEKRSPVLTFLSYPNNPTSNCFHEMDIKSIIQKSKGIVIIDEAYYPYSQKTFLNSIGDYENVLLMRSFSKMGLAAIRLGYLIGPTPIINYIGKLQLPFAINSLSRVTGEFILRHYSTIEKQVDIIIKERDNMKTHLEVQGISVHPSDSNYLIFRSKNHNSSEIFEYCLNKKIVIADLNGVHPLLQQHCRVSVGTPTENQLFLEAMNEFKIGSKTHSNFALSSHFL